MTLQVKLSRGNCQLVPIATVTSSAPEPPSTAQNQKRVFLILTDKRHRETRSVSCGALNQFIKVVFFITHTHTSPPIPLRHTYNLDVCPEPFAAVCALTLRACLE